MWNTLRQSITPDSKVHGVNMGPIWVRQDPGGPHVGPMDFAILDITENGKDIRKITIKIPHLLLSELKWVCPMKEELNLTSS